MVSEAGVNLIPPIKLLCITPQTIPDLAYPEGFAQTYGVARDSITGTVREVVIQNEAFRQTTGATPEWGGYLAIDPTVRAIVGTCAFKGKPDADGSVEIAYFTFPAHGGKGYATAMAMSLIDLAWKSGAVERITACTAPETNASTGILMKLGFDFLGSFEDPRDGTIWRWELPRGPGIHSCSSSHPVKCS